ncbi:MAG: orotidine-5'-phosphate decarboxylase [Armatimonadota bacterium]|nr:orotidine-5'-phosphate decarboxylase [Armatimonadota bacterium]
MPRLIVALDLPDLASARRVLVALRPAVDFFKVGSQLFTACGPDAVRLVRDHGAEVFLDLKFHDIPQTVEAAAAAAARLGVRMFNVHALGGVEMMVRARRGAHEGAADTKPPIVLGVTVLTSANTAALRSVGVAGDVPEAAVRLASLSRDAGLDGVVCSVHEVAAIKAACGSDFVAVVPGIRPREVCDDDQSRTGNLRSAVLAGADYVVVGRPILQAPDPPAVARATIEALDMIALKISHRRP